MADTTSSNIHRWLNNLKLLQFYNYLRDPLHRNAVFLIATSAASALIGFFFWTLAARLYPAVDVGRATAMVSAGNLIVILSGLGMGMGVLRFLAEEKDKNRLINTAITVVATAALVLAIIFLLCINLWSPALKFMQNSGLLIAIFILFCIFSAVHALNGNIFAAFRKAEYALYQSLFMAVKIILLLVFLEMGAVAILGSFTIGYVLSTIIAVLLFTHLLYAKYKINIGYDSRVISNIFRFSAGNYAGDILRHLPGVIMPLIVINLLGPEQNAYFYIAWMIATIYFMVAYASNISLVAENAHHPEAIRRQVLKTLKFAIIILIPAIIILYFLGGFLLSFFGEDYASEGLWLLRILIISSIPVAINETYIAICRIRKRVLPIIIIYGIISVFTLLLGYLLLDVLGLNGVGIAWLCAHVITMIIVLILIRKQLKFSDI